MGFCTRKDSYKVLGWVTKADPRRVGNLGGPGNSVIRGLKTLPLLACTQHSSTRPRLCWGREINARCSGKACMLFGLVCRQSLPLWLRLSAILLPQPCECQVPRHELSPMPHPIMPDCAFVQCVFGFPCVRVHVCLGRPESEVGRLP